MATESEQNRGCTAAYVYKLFGARDAGGPNASSRDIMWTRNRQRTYSEKKRKVTEEQ